MPYSPDVLRQCQLLERAYGLTHSDDELLGVPSHHEQVVLQSLRCRTTPAIFLADAFDQWIPVIRRSAFAGIRPAQYRRDCRRVARWSRKDLDTWKDRLDRHMGLVASGRTAESRGEHVYGFAFDTISSKYALVTGFGSHGLALEQVLIDVFGPPARWRDNKPAIIKQRLPFFVGGLVIVDVPGLPTPVLQILEASAPPALLRATLRFIKRQRLFVPIDHEYRYLPG